MVAVANFIVFSTMGIHLNPTWQERFRAGDFTDLDNFVHEVRRLCPFFPVIAGSARHNFFWQGNEFSAGDWVVLDLYASNHDPAMLHQPIKLRAAQSLR